MNKTFSRKEAIRFGWQTVVKNLWFFVTIMAISAILSATSSFTSGAQGRGAVVGFAAFLISLASIIIGIIVQIGLIRISLNFAEDKTSTYDDLFAHRNLFWKYVGASILYGLIVFGGLLLLVVPGIIWAIKYQFYRYALVEGKLGPVASLKKSAVITYGAKKQLFWFDLLLVGIAIVGTFLFGIGIFVAIPIILLAMAEVYKKLEKQSVAKETAVA